jgi:hypothetical protein
VNSSFLFNLNDQWVLDAHLKARRLLPRLVVLTSSLTYAIRRTTAGEQAEVCKPLARS